VVRLTSGPTGARSARRSGACREQDLEASIEPNERDESAGHVFISYVREDSPHVDRLEQALTSAGITVWRDTAKLWPGEDWRKKIRRAITDDALVFLACFSSRSLAREKSYQYEELDLAIEQLRLRRPDVPWLIPVRFDECEIPDDWDTRGGRNLRSIQWSDLFGNRVLQETERLITVVRRVLGQPSGRSARFTAGPGADSAPEHGISIIEIIRRRGSAILGPLTLHGLEPVLKVTAEALPNPAQVHSIAGHAGLSYDQISTGRAGTMLRWVSVFDAALEQSLEKLTLLLRDIFDGLDALSREALETALREVCLSYLSRINRVTFPELEDQAEAVLEASTVPEMNDAARHLRRTAFGVRRLLIGGQVAETCGELAVSIPELGQRCMELADLATEVVISVDRLQRLVPVPTIADPRQATEVGSGLRHAPPGDEALDRIYQQLEARQSAVRLGTRLRLGLGFRGSGTPDRPNLHDLLPVIQVAAMALPEEDQVDSIAAVSLPRRARRANGTSTPERQSPKQRWGSVFKAALVESAETLALLLDNIEDSLGGRGIGDLIAALREVLLVCLLPVTRVTHPEMGDQAEPLLEARTIPEMNDAAKVLRRTTLDVRALLMHPLLLENYNTVAPTVQDPEGRCMELADLAVDVVTSVDQLRWSLPDSDLGHTTSDHEALNRLDQRRLDAIRLGTRLLSGLRSDIRYP
jgi:hypothetical protein